jgi:hypothetical protein
VPDVFVQLVVAVVERLVLDRVDRAGQDLHV